MLESNAIELVSPLDNIQDEFDYFISETKQKNVNIPKLFELNAIEYTYKGQEVKAYDPLPEPMQNKLPYVAVTCILTKNCKAHVLALYDSGCSVCLLSEQFVNKFPPVLKEKIEPLNLSLGVATADSETRVVGKLKLMLAMSSYQGDKYPLMFVHEFYIAQNLSKDMYIGSDFILNAKIVIRSTNEGFDVHYPEQYDFPIDPVDITATKFIPFYLLDANEAGATNNSALMLGPEETAHIECNLTKPMQGKSVLIKNCSNFSLFASHPGKLDFMPQVYEKETVVDENNNIHLTVTNREKVKLPIYANSVMAVITKSYSCNEVDNFATEFLELNEIDVCLRYLCSPTEVENKKENGKFELNWMSFLEDDPTVQKMTNYLPYEPPSKSKMRKSDFTEQEFLDMFNFTGVDANTENLLKRHFIKHREAFAHFKMDIRECNSYVHDIEVIGDPILPKRRAIQDKVLPQVAEIVEGLVSYNVMDRGEPIVHYSNLVPVAKPDGSIRLCCDLIFLNKFIKSKEKIVQMGSPEQLLHRLFEHKYCFSMDFHQAYYHIRITKNCMKYYGIYSYRPFQEFLKFIRVIQGEKTSVFTFNKMINQIFGFLYLCALFWIDDLIVYSNSKQELFEKTLEIVKITDENGLSLSPGKMNFNRKEMKFLGKVINKEEGTYKIPEAKIQALLKIKPPINYKGVRSLMGILKFYNSHLPGVGIYAHPLQELLRKQTKEPFAWTSACQQAFLDLKASIAQNVVLNFPYKNGIYELYTDASKYTYGMVLYSKPRPPQIGEPKLVGMYSKSFPKEALQWGIYFKELYAVVWAVTHFIEHLYGEEIELYCDNKALLYVAAAKADHIVTYRLAMQLSGFNIAFNHCKSEKNKADFISRNWQSYIDQGIGKQKKRTVEEIEKEIENVQVKERYSAEEVYTLLTFNFKNPIDSNRIEECKKKHTEIIKNLKYDHPVINAGCCGTCKLEISNIEIHSQNLNYPLHCEENYFSSLDNCTRCRVPLSGKNKINEASAFSAFVPYSTFEKRRDEGNQFLNKCLLTPFNKIGFANEKTGFSMIKDDTTSNISQLNAIELLTTREVNEIDLEGTNSPQDDLSIFENMEIFKDFRYAYFDSSLEDSKYFEACNGDCGTIDALLDKNVLTKADKQLLANGVDFEATNIEHCTEENDENYFISYYDHLRANIFKFGILTVEKFREVQQNDAKIAAICKKLQSKSYKVKKPAEKKYLMHKNILFRKNQSPEDKLLKEEGMKIYIPDLIVPFILEKEHAPKGLPHVPGELMLLQIKSKYYFPNMEKLCKDYFSKCRICHYITKDTRRKQAYGHSKQVLIPLSHLVLDFAVGFPVTKEGYQNAISIMCSFTRYSVVMPTKTRESKELLEIFKRSWLPQFGHPRDITCDQEKSFIQGDFYKYMTSMGVTFHPTCSYHPESNGKAEAQIGRFKDTMTSLIKAIGDRKDWLENMHQVNECLNNKIHTSHGLSPFQALFCFKPHDPFMDILRMDRVIEHPDYPDSLVVTRIDRDTLNEYIKQKDEEKIAKNSKTLNAKTINRKFQIGEKVMRIVHTHRLAPQINRSLLGRFCGPYTIIKVEDYRLHLIEDAEMNIFEVENDKIISKLPFTRSTKSNPEKKKYQPKIIIDHKSHCKPFNQNEKDLKLPCKTFDQIDKLAAGKHSMVTRSKAVTQEQV